MRREQAEVGPEDIRQATKKGRDAFIGDKCWIRMITIKCRIILFQLHFKMRKLKIPICSYLINNFQIQISERAR